MLCIRLTKHAEFRQAYRAEWYALFVMVCSEEYTVYIGSHSHWFVALSVHSGVALWRTRLGDRIESTAALSACRRFVIVGQ